MSLPLSSPKDEGKVLASVSNREGFDVKLGVLIEGEDVSKRFIEGEWGQGEVPITLDATFAGNLPERFENGVVEVFVEVDGILVPQLKSAKSMLLPGEDYETTDVVASTAGSLFFGDDSIKLNDFTEFLGDSPRAIVEGVAKTLPYDGLFVEPVESPALTFAGKTGDRPGFLGEQPAGDVLDRVAEYAQYSYRDRAPASFVAYLPKPLSEGDRPARRYSSRDMPGWIRPQRADPQYYDVWVFKYDSFGELEYEAREVIPYVGWARPPQPGRTYPIPFDDTSADSAGNAHARALREAILLGRGVWAGEEITLPAFDPLVEREDRFEVTDDYEDAGEKRWEVVYLCRILSYKHSYGGEGTSAGQTDFPTLFGSSSNQEGTLDTLVTYQAAIVSKEEIKAPAFIGPDLTGGVIPTPLGPVGLDREGFWIDPDQAYNSQGVKWAGVDEDGQMWVDPALSEGLVGEDSGGLYVNLAIPGEFFTWGDTTPTFGDMTVATFGDMS